MDNLPRTFLLEITLVINKSPLWITTILGKQTFRQSIGGWLLSIRHNKYLIPCFLLTKEISYILLNRCRNKREIT